LILVSAATLLDGDPTNNFLERAVTFNPEGVLKGAVNCWVAGRYVYVCCPDKLVVVDVDEPLHPRVVNQVPMPGPRALEVQLRYAFVACASELTVLDLIDPAAPVLAVRLPLEDARGLTLCRTHAYVAQGSHGLAIFDLTKPLEPRLEQTWNADGKLDDATDVKVGMTNSSLFAYVADGKNGLRVVQLTAPEDPGAAGWSPMPRPRLVATFPTRGRALAISRGVDRDRAVDESGNQTAV